MLLRVTDFETTGMTDAPGAAICEIGWCDVTLTDGAIAIGTPEARFCHPGCSMPPEARAVHHISDADVANAPPPGDVLPVLGQPDYFVAHNAKFEQHFFPSASAPWICTWKVALRLWPEAPSHSNQTLRYLLGLELGEAAMPPHRAGPDAYVTAHLLAKMLADGRASIDDMARWSSGSPLMPRITFGKHRGAKFSEVDTDYLQWMLRQNFDEDLKANARHWLKSRGISVSTN